MTDDEIRESARSMVLSWLGEWALMLRSDQSEDAKGLDGYDRIIDRHIEELLTIRAGMAARWGYPPPPPAFMFEMAEAD